MAKTFQLVLLLGLSSGLWMEADAKCTKKGGCCKACPDGWMEIDSRCYLFRSHAKDWCNAESSCIVEGGNLASFHNPQEFAAIVSVVKNLGHVGVKVWLGGFDAVKEGSWKWSDGSGFVFKDWTYEVNNKPDDDDCMELIKGKIYDANCALKRAYVCSTEPKVEN